jgi:transcription-repair coupling factor (superfamily II helicase)
MSRAANGGPRRLRVPWDCLPYDRASPSREVMGRRMSALRDLLRPASGPRILVTTPDALLQRIPPRAVWKTALTVHRGETADAPKLLKALSALGYVEDDRVDEAGEVAFRGEVIDLYPAGMNAPYRLEMEDGRYTAIHCYDPLTQRTVEATEELLVGPASELVGEEIDRLPGAEHALADAYPSLETVFDILPKARLDVEPRAEERRRGFLAQVVEAYGDRKRADAGDAARPASPPERLYLTEAEWASLSKERLTEAAGEAARPTPVFAVAARPERAFTEFVGEELAAGRRVVLGAAAPADLKLMARRAQRAAGKAPEAVLSWADVLAAPRGTLLSLNVDLDVGFLEEASEVTVIAARDLLGSRAKTGDAEPAVVAPWQVEGDTFRSGDIAVHVDHGVAVLRGLEAVDTPSGARDTIRLEYAKGATLLAPVEEAARLWRYGAEEGAVALDHLNTDGWAKRRAKIHAEIELTARTLLELAAERERTEAPKLVPPPADYERFAARFPYAPTADQTRAIEETLADLASGRPMDRLVVGDVGFGKTEVALRAAAAAALSGKQVAVVAPTTVLARQHLHTFTRRFAELGVDVGHLSRLATPAEAKSVKAGLADGSIRVVVGTHALAGENVEFADLGLLVIDEEQRFGAAHKEKLRSLGEGVHVLTLTATPIPRTLQAALVGLQDLSAILTAPARRRPIRTFSTAYDAATVRAALLREKRRGGQSFVVVPRIEDMEPTAAELKALAPELEVLTAHGKMPAKDVDTTMVDFADGRGDVLLATSIIESGLDVPRANTMIVRRADLFGLAQLHQLRGRVGRGRVQGVCYLFTEAEAAVSEAVAKRLGTLETFDRLGAGMAISATDLDLRGAGDLVGEDQAGHLKLIGLSLYQQLLADALRAARGEPVDEWTTEFQIDVAGTVPKDYVPEAETRLNLYARLARATTPGDVEGLGEEIADRFGHPPQPVRNLLSLARARTLARAHRVTRIGAGPQAIALTFEPGVNPETAFAEAIAADEALQWTGERLLYKKPSETPEERAALVESLLDQLG